MLRIIYYAMDRFMILFNNIMNVQNTFGMELARFERKYDLLLHQSMLSPVCIDLKCLEVLYRNVEYLAVNSEGIVYTVEKSVGEGLDGEFIVTLLESQSPDRIVKRTMMDEAWNNYNTVYSRVQFNISKYDKLLELTERSRETLGKTGDYGYVEGIANEGIRCGTNQKLPIWLDWFHDDNDYGKKRVRAILGKIYGLNKPLPSLGKDDSL